MHKLEPPGLALGYDLVLAASSASPSHRLANPLFGWLTAVRDGGSISAAARALGCSYRHAWGELKRWERDMGQALLVWNKGREAKLTPFGHRLLWAHEQARARLAPLIDQLQAELTQGIARAYDDSTQLLTMAASHDLLLPRLRDHLATHAVALDIRYCGSVAALKLLDQGAVHVAGFHVADAQPIGSLTVRTFKRLLKPGTHKLIGFVKRKQGLAVAAGNPLQLRALVDVVRARYVNRPRGTGTRLEFDQLLATHGITPTQIEGYRREEPTHLAVASAIASGSADAGLCIEAAARQFGLDFVPVLDETYYLVTRKSQLNLPAIQTLQAALADTAWQTIAAAVPGYAVHDSGRILKLTEAMPWYRFSKPQPPTDTPPAAHLPPARRGA